MTRPDVAPPPVDRRIDVDGCAFRILSTPARSETDGPTYVLIHGIGMSHRYFTRLHERLAARANVHSIDLPGFGSLPKPGRDLDIPTMARLLGEVLDRIDARRVVLVGHSMGGQWVVELGAQRPDLVEAVVAIGPVTDDRHRSLPAQTWALAIESLGEPPTVNAIVFGDYVRCGMPWYLVQVRHMLAYPTEKGAAALTMPLLVLRGGSDPVAGLEWCRRLRDSAPEAALVIVPGHNHVVQHTGSRAVASALETFVAEVRA